MKQIHKPILPILALALSSSLHAQGDSCSTAVDITGTMSLTLNTASLTASGFNGGGSCVVGASTIDKDAFLTWTAPSSGIYKFDTIGSTFDTKLSVHLGSDCAATCLDYNDDIGGGVLQSSVTLINVPSGSALLIQLGGFNGAFGVAALNITEACGIALDDDSEDNDACVTGAGLPSLNNTLLNRFVSKSDKGYYEFSAESGATIECSLEFLDVQGVSMRICGSKTLSIADLILRRAHWPVARLHPTMRY